jgi:hypothetical protein
VLAECHYGSVMADGTDGSPADAPAFAPGASVVVRADDGSRREGTVTAADDTSLRVMFSGEPPRSWRQGLTCTVHGAGEGWTGEVLAVLDTGVWLHTSSRLADRRRAARAPVVWPAAWSGDSAGQGVVIDVASGGVRLRTDQIVDGIVMLTIRTGPGDVTAIAEVRHRTTGAGHTDHHLEFLAITPDSRDVLAAAIPAA